MNERIRLLAEQVGAVQNVLAMGRHDGVLFTETELEKFGLLIVQRCIEQASIGNGHGNNQWDRALTSSAKNIKEHFGVEE
jgi:hypothetical protein